MEDVTGRLTLELVEAERVFLDRARLSPLPSTWPSREDGVAHGIATALGLLTGEHPETLRARAARTVEEDRRDASAARAAADVARARARAALVTVRSGTTP